MEPLRGRASTRTKETREDVLAGPSLALRLAMRVPAARLNPASGSDRRRIGLRRVRQIEQRFHRRGQELARMLTHAPRGPGQIQQGAHRRRDLSRTASTEGLIVLLGKKRQTGVIAAILAALRTGCLVAPVNQPNRETLHRVHHRPIELGNHPRERSASGEGNHRCREGKSRSGQGQRSESFFSEGGSFRVLWRRPPAGGSGANSSDQADIAGKQCPSGPIAARRP